MEHCIALLRGVNVGKAKRIAMAELRQLAAELGGRDARTLLNSGNLVCRHPSAARLAQQLEAGIAERCGFHCRVLSLSAAELDAVIAANPLPEEAARDPARLLVAFADAPATLDACRDLADSGNDRLALGARAAYLWCADGILESALLKAFNKRCGDGVTTRNWATVLKLQQLARA